MRALVIGARGFLGKALTRCLECHGIDTLASSSRDPGGIDPETGQLSLGFSIPSDTDTVFYLAQSPGLHEVPPRVDHLLTVNVVSAVRAVGLARAAGVRRFIYTSTGNVYAPSFHALRESDAIRRDNWYALSKVHAEEALALADGEIDITVTRLFGLYGPGQEARLVPRLLAAIRDGRPVTLERHPSNASDIGGLRLSLCHVRDTAEILVALMGHSGPRCVNIASEEILSIRDIALAAGGALGATPRFEWTPSPRNMDLIADTSLLRATLSPRFTPFSEGIAETVRSLPIGKSPVSPNEDA